MRYWDDQAFNHIVFKNDLISTHQMCWACDSVRLIFYFWVLFDFLIISKKYTNVFELYVL